MVNWYSKRCENIFYADNYKFAAVPGGKKFLNMVSILQTTVHLQIFVSGQCLFFFGQGVFLRTYNLVLKKKKCQSENFRSSR